MPQGLFDKYKIEKADGTPVDPGAQYFVLRIDTDENARYAMAKYAIRVSADNIDLATDIMRWLSETPLSAMEKNE